MKRRTIFITGWLLLMVALAIALAVRVVEPWKYHPMEGDVIFQSMPHSPLVDAIEGVSQSPFSHCGIVHKVGESWGVIEAVGPVKDTWLPEWISQSRDKRYTVYRLKKPYREKIPAFIEAARSYEGAPYDFRYDMDDSAIYCSELVYKAFNLATGEELGKLQALGDMNWEPFTETIKETEGGELPLTRKMITPRAVSEAPQLEKVFTNGQ